MNLEELKNKLYQETTIKNKYFIGRPSDNRYCLVFEDNKWMTFYYERGRKLRLKTYDTEIEACTAFWDYMMEIKERR